MCVLALAWKAHPDWPLILAGNRDELHERASAPAARWPDHPHIIAGRDLVSGGSWLGISETGRLAVVTNVSGHGLPDPARLSRGGLVTDWLASPLEAPSHTVSDPSDYNPFNLITIAGNGAHFVTNRPETAHASLAGGLYGLSNGTIDDGWHRADSVKRAVGNAIAAGDPDPDRLLDALGDEVRPNGAPDGSDVETLAARPDLAPVFIRNPRYGTRCSSVICIDSQGNGRFVERRFDATGAATGETRLAFRWG